MPNLKETQKQFLQEVYQKKKETTLPIREKGLTKSQSLAIYQNNLFSTLTANLKSKYPVICRFVDERFFNYACDEYIKQHPSASGNLDDYGEEFPKFLKHFKPTENIDYLKDLAQLEWLFHRCYIAGEAETLSIKRLGQTIELTPSTFILYSKFSLDQLWSAGNKDDESISDINPHTETILLVYRTKQFEIRVKNLLPDSKLLEIMQSNSNPDEEESFYLIKILEKNRT